MQALICELCGSQELIKQDGYYVCQSCGTKFTVEEARKMMIDGTVDVKGKVSIDNSEVVQKFLQNARRAKEKGDWEETEKYYNLVEQNDPSNLEAIFYSSYGKAKASLVDSDLYKRQAAFKVLINCVSIIDDNFDIAKNEENKKIIDEISADILVMRMSEYVYNQRKNGYGMVTWTDKMETVTLFNGLSLAFMESLENIANKFPEDEKEKRIDYIKTALAHAAIVLEAGSLANPSMMQNRIMGYHKTLHDLDPSHEIPATPPAPGAKQKAGCYVATAVYGSYDCPEVWTLRRWRDETLAETWYGRAFIRTYYAFSPFLVRHFGDSAFFRNFFKPKLDKKIADLREQGVESTPYEDKNW